VSPVGAKTAISYAPRKASDRPFVASVRYGGIADDYQYRIDLSYEPVPRFFASYASGEEQVLDRRVTRVTVLARDAQSGSFAERWHHDLHYQQDSWGPAFYLVGVDQTFASGEAAP